MKVFVIFAAVIITSVVGKVPYQDCGSKSTITNVIISGCDNQPICPLKKNTNVTFEVDFTSKEAATKLTTVVHGIVEHVPVPFPMVNPDACKNCGITCPIKSSESLKYKTSIFVKPAYPSVKLIVKWELKDDSGNDVFCIEVPAQVTS